MDKKKEEKNNNIPKEEMKLAEEKKEEKSYDVLWDKYLRLQADFDNYKKRSHRERMEFIKFANEMLILELLEILDNFERAEKAADQKKDFNLLHQGVDMTAKQLHSLLEAKGLKRIMVIGEKFDPHFHEPMEVVEEEGVEEDTIVEEMQAGYTLNSRIIRPAKVKVKRGKKVEETEKEKIIEETLKEKENGGSEDGASNRN